MAFPLTNMAVAGVITRRSQMGLRAGEVAEGNQVNCGTRQAF